MDSFKAAIAVLTNEPTKSNPRYCQLCDADKAVGKYYVDPSESENHGWWRVCSCCAEMVSNVGANVEFYKYSQEYKNGGISERHTLPDHVEQCDHDFEKWGNVGEHDKKRDAIFDWMKCNHCGVYGKRFGLGHQPVQDLMMEIDLSCCR